MSETVEVWSCRSFYDICSLNAIPSCACVHLEVGHESVRSVSQCPNLYPPLYRFLWHVLLQGGASFERNHGLIHTDVLSRIVHRLKGMMELVYDRLDLSKLLVVGATRRRKYAVVSKVQVPTELKEPVSGYP